MSKEKILDIIASAKREFPSTWQSVALDWLHDLYAEKGSHFTREQVRQIVWSETGVEL